MRIALLGAVAALGFCVSETQARPAAPSFSGTIEANIRLGNAAIRDEGVRAGAGPVRPARLIARLRGG